MSYGIWGAPNDKDYRNSVEEFEKILEKEHRAEDFVEHKRYSMRHLKEIKDFCEYKINDSLFIMHIIDKEMKRKGNKDENIGDFLNSLLEEYSKSYNQY